MEGREVEIDVVLSYGVHPGVAESVGDLGAVCPGPIFGGGEGGTHRMGVPTGAGRGNTTAHATGKPF